MSNFKKEWVEILGTNDFTTLTVSDWTDISEKKNLPLDFIDFFANYLNWYFISKTQNLNEAIMDKFADKIFWSIVVMTQKMSDNFLERHTEKLCWNLVLRYQTLSESFIDKFIEYCNPCYISRYQHISDDFAKKHFKLLDPQVLLFTQNLSPEMILKCEKKCKVKRPIDICFNEDILPLRPCNDGSIRFKNLFPTNKRIPFHKIINKYREIYNLDRSENRAYIDDLVWFCFD